MQAHSAFKHCYISNNCKVCAVVRGLFLYKVTFLALLIDVIVQPHGRIKKTVACHASLIRVFVLVLGLQRCGMSCHFTFWRRIIALLSQSPLFHTRR